MQQYSESEIHEIVQSVMLRMANTGHPTKNSIQPSNPPPFESASSGEKKRTIALGSDHGGYELKETIKGYLNELDYSVSDCGTNDKNPVDYPDIAHTVAKMVSNGQAWRGIIIDGAGIGSCMVANKVPGIRAALCYDHASAANSREHNDANVLTLGAGLIGTSLAKQIIKTWLETDFGGGRHAGRVEKIGAIEKQYFKGTG
jgi:ribose 5-phosphate isomerase B